jgi:uncharacterized protein (DUF4415 family)
MLQQQTEWKQNFQEFSVLAAKQHDKLDAAVKNQEKEYSAALAELKEKTGAAAKQQHDELDAAIT